MATFDPCNPALGQTKDPVAGYDEAMGTQKPNIKTGECIPEHPKAPDPNPFSIGKLPGGQ